MLKIKSLPASQVGVNYTRTNLKHKGEGKMKRVMAAVLAGVMAIFFDVMRRRTAKDAGSSEAAEGKRGEKFYKGKHDGQRRRLRLRASMALR